MRDAYAGSIRAGAMRRLPPDQAHTIPHWDQRRRDHVAEGRVQAATRSTSPRAWRRSPSPVAFACRRRCSNRCDILWHDGYEPAGEQRLKNIRHPVTVYAIRAEACSSWISMPAMPRQSIPVTTATAGRRRISPSLAVLPFRTLQKDKSDAYFAEGMIDDIVRALGGLKDLLVISRSSTIGVRALAAGSAPCRARARRALRAARQRASGAQSSCGSPLSCARAVRQHHLGRPLRR